MTRSSVVFILASFGCDQRKADVKWSPPVTAQECIAQCGPLPVTHFTPHCSRQLNGSQFYYCSGKISSFDDVCSCGVKSNKERQESSSSPDLVTPVIVHHGLKFILGK